MRWAAAALLAMTALLWGSAPPVRACSGPGPEYFFEHAKVIAEGRIVGWDVATDIPAPSWGSTPIRVHLTVSRTYKGSASQELTFLDKWSLTRRDGLDAWVAHTSCPNPFASDPRGKAGIVGIMTDEFDGSEYPVVFFIGDSLSGEEYRQAVSALVAALPPVGGTPDRADGYPKSPATFIVAGSILVLLSAASFVFPAKGSQT